MERPPEPAEYQQPSLDKLLCALYLILQINQGDSRIQEYDCGWDVFNLGNSRPITILEMISGIEAALGRKAVIENLPEQPGDVPITYADISKANRLLGYNPITPFPTGLVRMAGWLQKLDHPVE